MFDFFVAVFAFNRKNVTKIDTVLIKKRLGLIHTLIKVSSQFDFGLIMSNHVYIIQCESVSDSICERH